MDQLVRPGQLVHRGLKGYKDLRVDQLALWGWLVHMDRRGILDTQDQRGL